MFPLKRSRKFPRIAKKGLVGKIHIDGYSYDIKFKNISVDGCYVNIIDENVSLNDDAIPMIEFEFNGRKFLLNARKVRNSAYKFIVDDIYVEAKDALSRAILGELFKEAPNLMPTDKEVQNK